MKKIFKITGRILLTILLLCGGITLCLRIPAVQNYIAHIAVNYLSKKLGTKVEIKSFSWNLFRDIDMRGFYMADRNGDTLIYAGTLNAEVAYWSFFKREFKIKGIKLENAKIHLRNDTSGHLNLSALFADTKSVAVDNTKLARDTAVKVQPLPLLIELESIRLSNTDFRFEDIKKHLLVSVQIPDCNIGVNKLAMQKKLIDIHTVSIDGVRAAVTVENKDENQPPPSVEPFRFLPEGWEVRWDGITISRSTFAYNDINKQPKQKVVDFAHLLLTDIGLKTSKGAIFRDSISLNIKSLTAKEKSGFELRKLSGLAKVSTGEINLRNLSLQTGNSNINSYASLTYSDFEDFKDFTHKVAIKADMQGTQLSVRDINYFFPKLDALAHNTINISGRISGKIDALQGKNIVLSTATGTYIKCNFYSNGLPTIDETSLNFRIDQFVTSASDIRLIYPSSVYPPNMNTLGRITFSGDFDGFLSDFVTRGKLYTDIGSATSDINFKYNKKDAKSAYSGDLALKDFDLGKWFGDPVTYGKVSLTANLEGGGVKLETLNAKMLGDVSDLTIRGYDYKDIKVDGLVKGKFFSGNLIVKDQYLNADFTGTVDMTGQVPRYNFAATLHNANLRELHITKDTLNLSGDVTADLSGRKPDDMIGTLMLNHIFVQHGQESVMLRNLTLTSAILADSRKEIKLKSDNIDGNITGRFSFVELPRALRSYVNYTFTKNYQDTTQLLPQQFTFDLHVYDSSAISRVIDPRFKEVLNTTISGEFNSVNHILNINGTVPELVFDKYMIRNFSLNAASVNGNIDVLAGVDKVFSNDSVMIDELLSHSYTEGDEFRFDLKLSDAKRYNMANLTAFLKPLSSSVEIRFLPSEVWLGGNKWSFAPNNRIIIHGKQITTDSLIFASGIQSIRLESYLKNGTSTSVNLVISETSLSDFVNIFSTKIRDLKGTVNGTLKVEDIFSNPTPIGYVELKDFYLGKIPVGIIKVNSTFDRAQKKINIGATLFGDKSNLAINGYYDLANDNINLDNDITTLNLDILNYPLFAKYVRRVTGTASAKLNLHGPLKALDLSGNLRINDAKVNVSYLNTTYTIKNQDVQVADGYIDIGSIDIIDSFNNKATGTGRIYHNHFKKVTLDLHVNTEQLHILNTTVKEMPVFYGNGLVKGKVDFMGTIPEVTIRAYAQVRPGTHCAIPINNTYETNRYSFYRFVPSQKDSIKAKRKEDVKVKGVNFILDLDVNPDGVLDIVLDPAAGDVLSTRGRGDLKVEILRSGEFSIYGRYEIDEGNYLFTMQNIVNKKFELEKGGTITFKGDVNNAQLDADAVYHVKTSTYDLISDLIAANNQPGSDVDLRARNRINVDLMLKMKGVLQSPEISFDIRPIDPDPAVRTYVDNKMQLMRATESEMNKQVFGLLVMNRFLPSGNSSTDAITSGRSIGNSATNTISEFLSSQLSLYTGSFFESLNVKGLDLLLNFQTYDQTSLIAGQNADNLNARKQVQLALTKKFFNNRLSINVGGNVDFGDNYQSLNPGVTTNNKTAYATGDFEVEYVLDKKGTWRAKTYNRNDYDNFNNRNINKTGIGISFRQDFDTWGDLFRRIVRKKSQTSTPPAAKPEEAPKVKQR